MATKAKCPPVPPARCRRVQPFLSGPGRTGGRRGVDSQCANRLRDLAQNLSEKGSIPSVAAQMELSLEIGTDDFWTYVTLPKLESVRVRLRGLVKFADKEQGRNRVFVNFEDKIGEGVHIILTATDPSLNQYREKVRHYLRDHMMHCLLYTSDAAAE